MFEVKNTLKKTALVLMLASLSACGGGGSATGGLTEFSVIPDSWTLKAESGNLFCEVATSQQPEVTITVVGGTPPYRIVNSKPQKIAISQSVLTEKNPSFKAIALGGCGADLSVLILDSRSRSVTFKFTFEAGEDPTAATPTPTT